ncbi:MAG TPA: heavy-metal-associated domain-containing protein [bacterium]|nr:heavy-metal-associated domain-containing protein [bacterium]
MMTLKFKTNIKCGGCVATVTPHLDSEKTIEKWHVDLQSPERFLTVEGSEPNEEMIFEKVKQAGFTIEKA